MELSAIKFDGRIPSAAADGTYDDHKFFDMKTSDWVKFNSKMLNTIDLNLLVSIYRAKLRRRELYAVDTRSINQWSMDKEAEYRIVANGCSSKMYNTAFQCSTLRGLLFSTVYRSIPAYLGPHRFEFQLHEDELKNENVTGEYPLHDIKTAQLQINYVDSTAAQQKYNITTTVVKAGTQAISIFPVTRSPAFQDYGQYTHVNEYTDVSGAIWHMHTRQFRAMQYVKCSQSAAGTYIYLDKTTIDTFFKIINDLPKKMAVIQKSKGTPLQQRQQQPMVNIAVMLLYRFLLMTGGSSTQRLDTMLRFGNVVKTCLNIRELVNITEAELLHGDMPFTHKTIGKDAMPDLITDPYLELVYLFMMRIGYGIKGIVVPQGLSKYMSGVQRVRWFTLGDEMKWDVVDLPPQLDIGQLQYQELYKEPVPDTYIYQAAKLCRARRLLEDGRWFLPDTRYLFGVSRVRSGTAPNLVRLAHPTEIDEQLYPFHRINEMLAQEWMYNIPGDYRNKHSLMHINVHTWESVGAYHSVDTVRKAFYDMALKYRYVGSCEVANFGDGHDPLNKSKTPGVKQYITEFEAYAKKNGYRVVYPEEFLKTNETDRTVCLWTHDDTPPIVNQVTTMDVIHEETKSRAPFAPDIPYWKKDLIRRIEQFEDDPNTAREPPKTDPNKGIVPRAVVVTDRYHPKHSIYYEPAGLGVMIIYTHFDNIRADLHGVPETNKYKRAYIEKQLKAVYDIDDFLMSVKGKEKGRRFPCVAIGDFNVHAGSTVYKAFQARGWKDVSPRAGTIVGGNQIDFIFTRNAEVTDVHIVPVPYTDHRGLGCVITESTKSLDELNDPPMDTVQLSDAAIVATNAFLYKKSDKPWPWTDEDMKKSDADIKKGKDASYHMSFYPDWEERACREHLFYRNYVLTA